MRRHLYLSTQQAFGPLARLHVSAGRAVPLSLFALALAASVALAVPPQYRVTLISPISGSEDVLHAPRALNDAAWVVGDFGASSPGGDFGYRAYLWRPDVGSVDIGTPPGLPTVLPKDINNRGQIAGTASQTLTNAWSTGRTFRWEEAGGFMVFPQFVEGRGSETGFMNDDGRIVGNGNDGSFSGMKALEFVAPDTLRQLFPDTPGYNWGIDINNVGQVLATSIEGLVRIEPDGSHTVLPTMTGRGIDPDAMNDLGDVVGSSRVVNHPEGSLAAIYLEGQGWLSRASQGRFNTAVSINNHREVVGNTRDNTGARGNHGWRWSEADGLVPLEDLIADPPATYAVLIASDINNRGQIAGVVMNRATGTTYGAVLTPVGTPLVPPPSCLADVGVQGGAPGQDGQLDNNDFIAFIDHFFAQDLIADCGAAGGLSGSDGVWDNNDFIVFISQFFAGC